MKGVFLLLVSCAALALVSAVHQPWPKLHCQPGYDSAGTEHSKNNHMACQREVAKNPKMCKKECLYRWTSVMPRTGKNELSSVNAIENTLRRNYFTDTPEGNESAKTLANKVHSECKAKLEEVKDKSCKEWTDFYACVDGILDSCPDS